MIILKFGGTSVTNCCKEIVEIIKKNNYKYNNILVVFSALSGITNKLLNLLNYENVNKDELNEIELIHREYILKNINNNNNLEQLNVILFNIYQDLKKDLQKFFNTTKNHNIFLKYSDIIASYGEKISIQIFYFILLENDLVTKIITNNLIVTDSINTNAFPNFDLTQKNIEQFICPLLKDNKILLYRGFVGISPEKEITTLGRSGSDFTATILGRYLKPKEIIIYTDVNGILTADPRKVKKANNIKEISYREMGEMAFFGAKVFHSKTFIPLENLNIDVKVLNTFNLLNKGTIIKNKYNYRGNKKFNSINSINNNVLVTINGKGMQGTPGISAKLFNCLYKKNINVTFITQASSEQTICFTIDNIKKNLVEEILNIEFDTEIRSGKIKNININNNISIITIIGEQLSEKIGFAGEIFSLLGDNKINIKAISQGSSELSISFIISKDKELETLNILHSLIE